MKIGIVFPAVEYGGQEKNLVLLSNELYKKNKYDLEILSYGNKNFTTATINPNIKRINLTLKGIKFVIINLLISLITNGMVKMYLKSSVKIAGYLITNKYNTLICFQAGGLISFLKILTMSKTKIITRESTSPISMTKIQKSPFFYSFRINLKKFFYNFSDLIIANSNGSKNEINNLLKKDKAIQINNICDFSNTKVISATKFDPIFKSSTKKLITVGRLNATKRVDILLKATKKILETHNVDLIVVGEGPEKHKLKKIAKDLNISEKVHFIGFSDEIHNWIANSDVYVSASIVEGSPNSIIESVCLGTPVVAADCNYGPKEILNNGKIGILVPINNTPKMIKSINNILDNEELRKELGKLSKKQKSNYSADKISELYIKEITKLNEIN